MGMSGYFYIVDAEDKQTFVEDHLDTIDDALDIDKSWDALYRMAGDIDFIPSAEQYVIDEQDTDYPIFFVEPQKVKEISAQINSIDEKKLRELYDFDTLLENGVYPIQEDEDPEEFFEYIKEHFEALKPFYEKASSENKAIGFILF
ncbi:DUF1877 family protein [Longirhabdus pacifica]|uniref:DUF1877 family protein n=1 Tax=Longirhabdus pacifica TaxID=2305227 RepID=UPI0010087653|nr:DUF1877 family protein [Longirhabdus pacifica]